MTDYKNTLNLPQTHFPMKADLAKRELDRLKKWEELELYQKIREKQAGKKLFILHDGPPYANGEIHLGHALNKILKDIIIKAKTLDNFDAPYVPGWDCHGLPIEVQVEKKLEKNIKNNVGNKHLCSVSKLENNAENKNICSSSKLENNTGNKNICSLQKKEFRKICREYASQQITLQRESFKRLGILGEWEHPYLTMDFKYEANIVRALGKILEKKHIKRGFKPVYWCLDCQSALAEAEVEYQNKKSSAIDVRFQVIDTTEFCSRFSQAFQETTLERTVGSPLPIHIPIWTTTPWTLPANQAVALHPELKYLLIQCESECLLIAESLLNSCLDRYEIKNYKIIGNCLGKNLEKLLLQHPFYGRAVPIVLGEHVTTDAGTGAVHTAPGHGMEDYQVALQYQLLIENPVGPDGKFLPNTELLAGQFIYKANNFIIELLKNNHKLIKLDSIEHSYPHCWRHKTPVIFRATPQWFISMDENHLREKTLEKIPNVNWHIDWGMARMTDMIANRPDWCISRQRTWGTPVAFLIHKNTGELHPKQAELIEKTALAIEKNGIDAWDDSNLTELLGREADQYEKAQDILDVWFESGVSHFAVANTHPHLKFPADLYIEGNDQYRGWFHSALLTGVAISNQAPYKNIITHGFTVDQDGRKMSKSLGNVISPEQINKTLGAEILRLWVASADYRTEISCSDEILKRTTDVYRRIRNTARFLLSNIHDFDPKQHLVPAESMLALDRFIIHRALALQKAIQENYNMYQFYNIYQKIHHFCSIDLGSFYLDIVKDRQYTTPQNSLARRSAQTAMYHILEALVRWIAPILSFTADEIWEHLPKISQRESSVFLSTWYENLIALPENNNFNADFWDKIMRVRNLINKEIEKLRNENKLGSSLEAEVIIYADEANQALLNLLSQELRFVLITSEAIIKPLNIADINSNIIATEITGLSLSISASTHPKCVRCWHRRPDIGLSTEHPELCERCIENIGAIGETRRFA